MPDDEKTIKRWMDSLDSERPDIVAGCAMATRLKAVLAENRVLREMLYGRRNNAPKEERHGSRD